MNIMAEVKITILDGEERGVVHTFTTTGETQQQYTEIGIIEKLKLEWNHICPYRSIRASSTGVDIKDETQITKDILHRAIDNSYIADDVYPNLREELHKVIESVESEVE